MTKHSPTPELKATAIWKQMEDARAIQCTTNDGMILYYTGRAGEGWLSENPEEAFTDYTELSAERKIRLMNAMHSADGLHFSAITLKQLLSQKG